LAYLQLGTVNVDQFCKTQGGRPFAEMRSGCDTTSCGPSPLDTAAPSVVAYDGDGIAAAASGTTESCTSLYNATEPATTAQYTPEEFAHTMNRQVAQIGRIVGITGPSGAITVQYDKAGQSFFALAQTVSLEKHGKTSTRDVTSYFFLEGGQWLFWFSA